MKVETRAGGLVATDGSSSGGCTEERLRDAVRGREGGVSESHGARKPPSKTPSSSSSTSPAAAADGRHVREVVSLREEQLLFYGGDDCVIRDFILLLLLLLGGQRGKHLLTARRSCRRSRYRVCVCVCVWFSALLHFAVCQFLFNVCVCVSRPCCALVSPFVAVCFTCCVKCRCVFIASPSRSTWECVSTALRSVCQQGGREGGR